MTLPLLYVIADYETASRYGWELPDFARACFAGGAKLLQVRAPKLASDSLLGLSEQILKESLKWDARVIVNDRTDVAALAGCSGVHLGQNDLSPSSARSILGSDAFIGVSTHTMGQVDEAIRDSDIDYLGVGPIYATSTKATGYSPIGVEFIAEASRRAAGRPLVGVGGITLERAENVIRAGACSVAVISDILMAGNPEKRVASYVRQLADCSK